MSDLVVSIPVIPVLERTDNRVVREAILALTQSEARRHGIGKSTLHYLRQNARRGLFRPYGKTVAKLKQLGDID